MLRHVTEYPRNGRLIDSTSQNINRYRSSKLVQRSLDILRATSFPLHISSLKFTEKELSLQGVRATNKQKSPPSSLGDGSRFLSGGVQHIGLPGALHRLSISRERHFSASRRRRQRKGVRSRPLHLTAAATSLCLRSQASCHRPLGLRCHAVPPHNSWCGVGFSCSRAHTFGLCQFRFIWRKLWPLYIV